MEPSPPPPADDCERPEPGTFPYQGEADPRLCLTLVLDATTVVQGDVLEGVLVIENMSADEITVGNPDRCPTDRGFYRDGERVGGPGEFCPQEPMHTTFRPNEVKDFSVSLLACSVGDRPGGPMPPDTYLAGASFEPNEPSWYAPAVEVTVTEASDRAAAEKQCRWWESDGTDGW